MTKGPLQGLPNEASVNSVDEQPQVGKRAVQIYRIGNGSTGDAQLPSSRARNDAKASLRTSRGVADLADIITAISVSATPLRKVDADAASRGRVSK